MLVRFPDILDNRIEKISCCFRQAAEEYGYKAENFIIYPIKVNQMRPVVEEIISHGKKFNLGLEAGSKPELHALIAGVFRAGGDTKFGLVCDTIDMWCYAVPLGFIAAFVFKLPVLVVYFLLCTDEFVKWPWVLKRYKSGLWAKNITRDHLFEDEEKE